MRQIQICGKSSRGWLGKLQNNFGMWRRVCCVCYIVKRAHDVIAYCSLASSQKGIELLGQLSVSSVKLPWCVLFSPAIVAQVLSCGVLQ